jgi:hypothetical protein
MQRPWKRSLTAWLVLGALNAQGSVQADSDEWEGRSYPLKGPGSVHYRQECGSCHIAYPPRFLGKASWKRVMENLDQHFGESAELEPKEQQQILQYLTQHSGTSRWYQLWKRSGEQRAPLRITETRAFRHEHDEIPLRLLGDKLRSLSQCEQCHIQADRGRFSEHQIRMPGGGRWYDE